MLRFRYDMIGASLLGVRLHPQLDMIKLGYDVKYSYPVTIADCWMFFAEKDIDDRPEYISCLGEVEEAPFNSVNEFVANAKVIPHVCVLPLHNVEVRGDRL